MGLLFFQQLSSGDDDVAPPLGKLRDDEIEPLAHVLCAGLGALDVDLADGAEGGLAFDGDPETALAELDDAALQGQLIVLGFL